MLRLFTLLAVSLWGCQFSGFQTTPENSSATPLAPTPTSTSVVQPSVTPSATPLVAVASPLAAQPSTAPAASATPCAPTTSTSRVSFGSRSIPVDLAWTPASRQQGLSGRPCLAKDTGLVLGWDEPTPVSIWMPNMNFAIDVIFVRAEKVVSIYSDAQPCIPGQACPAFGPKDPVDYVLEVPAGSAVEWGLTVGDRITLKK